MSRLVLIAHAPGDEDYAEQVAASVRSAGYEATHSGTVLVGESVFENVSKALIDVEPVVLCGTIREMGTGWAYRTVNAARGLNPQVRIYGVAIEKDAYLQPLTLDGEVAEFWRAPKPALDSVVTALLRHYPPVSSPPPRPGPSPAA